MAEQLILYTTPGCDVCDRARSDLRAEGTPFEERDVMKDKAWFNEVLKYSISVPVVIRDGKAEVGWKGALG
ncbi:MAG TPA: glutaredoxin domain-containing protein [Dehalococcoidia bacterium]|jgi:glutaredoxin|nr:glutaredoxin domain-containing protein [Dehalococcoidia bacterium]